jgi:hypothetical protein
MLARNRATLGEAAAARPSALLARIFLVARGHKQTTELWNPLQPQRFWMLEDSSEQTGSGEGGIRIPQFSLGKMTFPALYPRFYPRRVVSLAASSLK